MRALLVGVAALLLWAIASYMVGPELEREVARDDEFDDEWGPMY